MKKLRYALLCMLSLPISAAEKAADKSEYIIGCNVAKNEVTTGLFKVHDRKPELVCEYNIATDKIADFAQYIAPLVTDINEKHNVVVKRACFAAPGNTNAQKNCIKAPHLPFVVDGIAIEKATSIEKALVVNDFETIGFGVQAINPKEIVTLHEGKPRAKGTQVIVGAGNGLGSGLMLWDAVSQSYLPSPLSYSFVDFAPENELELEFARYLQRKPTESRSWGKVLGASGGILRIYDFLDLQKLKEYKSPAKQYEQYTDVFAHRNDDERCADAVALYMKLYARLIRNVAYAQLPYNGLYITNTVAEKYPELFKDPLFLKEVFNTGNQYLLDYLKEIPVYLATHPKLQLYGAAQYLLVYDK